ncbi:MAG TPA: DUF2142 domain-containing protein, partial [Acidimicrobiales bacterium]|nr:DUF2142 domain-containing protein [Acidimicrobiales bacterium]
MELTASRTWDATGGARHRGPKVGRARPRRLGVVFFVSLVVTFLNFAAWSLATPLFASPDEQAQVVYAAAAARGQLVGTTIEDAANPYTIVTVPKVFASGDTYPNCFHFHPEVPASCAPRLTTSRRIEHTTTYVGRYPPLYYLVVGLPSLAFVSR